MRSCLKERNDYITLIIHSSLSASCGALRSAESFYIFDKLDIYPIEGVGPTRRSLLDSRITEVWYNRTYIYSLKLIGLFRIEE